MAEKINRPSTPAERARLSRERREQGLVAVNVDLPTDLIPALVEGQFLSAGAAGSVPALGRAVSALLDEIDPDAVGKIVQVKKCVRRDGRQKTYDSMQAAKKQ